MKASLNDMDMKAQTMAFRVGVGIVKSAINGRNVECKTRLNHGTSGKAYTTIWYVDGKRTARANIESAL